FATSNNAIFGKTAMDMLTVSELNETAHNFGFGTPLTEMMPLDVSHILTPKTHFNMAELASGFNKATTISPIHGALIASIIINNGELISPFIIEKVTDSESDKIIWEPSFHTKQVLAQKHAEDLKNMMKSTISQGTARSFKRDYKGRALLKKLIIGGKTGSISGGKPFGKYDWFITFAGPKDRNNKGISLCVMIVNQKKWYVKATHLAKEILWDYFKTIHPIL
ncbi:penicillin-binding transpeptidase domain-containing protein, partial [Bacteriovoracaceae bacterium]|nr:penicillin-binding transpeptidase domain-containing protein [Bacteriovoracaceae bacterium]